TSGGRNAIMPSASRRIGILSEDMRVPTKSTANRCNNSNRPTKTGARAQAAVSAGADRTAAEFAPEKGTAERDRLELPTLLRHDLPSRLVCNEDHRRAATLFRPAGRATCAYFPSLVPPFRCRAKS